MNDIPIVRFDGWEIFRGHVYERRLIGLRIERGRQERPQLINPLIRREFERLRPKR